MVRLVLTVLLAALGTACAGACRVQLYVAAGGKLADRAPVAGQVAKVLVDANTQVKGGTQRVVQDEPCHDLDPISDIMTYIAPLLTGRVARDRRQPPHRYRLCHRRPTPRRRRTRDVALLDAARRRTVLGR
jgi:hypothetical protein